jgi:hypothetical protein
VEQKTQINPRSYAHLIFDKGAQNIQWRKDSFYNKCGWENCISACRKLKLDPCFSPCTRIISKRIKDVNFEVSAERVGNTLELVCTGNDFLSRTQMAQQLRERIDKWDYK